MKSNVELHFCILLALNFRWKRLSDEDKVSRGHAAGVAILNSTHVSPTHLSVIGRCTSIGKRCLVHEAFPLSGIRRLSAIGEQKMYCIYRNNGCYIDCCPLYGRCPLLGGSGGSTVFYSTLLVIFLLLFLFLLRLFIQFFPH